MFLQRAATTFTVGPLALLLIYLGGFFYFIPLLLIISLAAFEYVNLMRAMRIRVPLWLLLPAVWGQLVAMQWPEWGMVEPALLVSFLAAMLYVLWTYEQQRSDSAVADWVALVGGIVLLGWVAGHFFRLRHIDGLEIMAIKWTILTLVATWLADSAAYLIGTWRGKHKLAPRLSPNKTVEGYVAGIVLGTIFTLLLGYLMHLPLATVLLVSLLVSTISPAGDLGISLFKREAGVKDSGHMLPGHGGALDRIDSLVWSVAMAYYVVTYFS